MKSFKSFVKSDKEDAGTIPAPIHFKHIPEVETKKGVIPSPITFKQEYTFDEPELKEAKKDKPSIHDWIKENDNTHLFSKKVKNNEGLSNFLSKSNKNDDEDTEHVTEYCGETTSTELNSRLLKNKKLSDYHKETSDGIDRHIDKNKMKHELHVYSGLSFDPEKHMKKNKLHSPCYISTTHDKQIASEFSEFNKPNKKKKIQHIAHIHLKPGDSATHISEHSLFPEEHETLIKRGSTLKHHGYKEHHDEKTGDVVRVHHFTIV